MTRGARAAKASQTQSATKPTYGKPRQSADSRDTPKRAQITIAASRAARFTAGKAVKDALNGG